MAKRQIETEIDINAPAAKVWAILTDFARMGLWNPFITSIAGKAAAGLPRSIFFTARDASSGG